MIALLLAAAAAPPQPSQLKLFRDWTVGCDNVRTCRAVALLPADMPEDGMTMTVSRAGGPDAQPRITVGGDYDEGVVAVAIAVEGRKIAALGGRGEVDAAGRAAVVAALRTGTRLQALDAKGKSIGTISLAGASAALLYMDDAQQRVGTVTALARPGPKPATAVPAPPPPPEITVPAASPKPPRAMPLANAAALRKQACDSGEPDDKAPAETWRLDATHTLAIVPDHCDSGAYNQASLVLVAGDTGPWTPAAYDTPTDKDPEGRPSALAYNVDWDRKAGELDMFMKGRGLGDCGVRQTYVWDGARFRLTFYAEMSECRGSAGWIGTWRAEAVRR